MRIAGPLGSANSACCVLPGRWAAVRAYRCPHALVRALPARAAQPDFAVSGSKAVDLTAAFEKTTSAHISRPPQPCELVMLLERTLQTAGCVRIEERSRWSQIRRAELSSL